MPKVNIVTSAKELNYGAILQAYALQETLTRLGESTELLWWSNQKNSNKDIRFRKLFAIGILAVRHPTVMKKAMNSYSSAFFKEFSPKSRAMFKEFEEKHLKIKYLNYSEMKRYAHGGECKAVICGSDQIWNSYAIYVDPFYYLRFVPQTKRIAYAPSFGKKDIPKYNQKSIGKYISEIPNVSVREKTGKSIIYNLVNKEVPVVLDPSFLLNYIDWKKLENKVLVPEKYILFYFLDMPDEIHKEKIQKIQKDLNLPIIALPYDFKEGLGIKNIHYVDAGPSEFLFLVRNATYILTDSFHGTAFSINYKKNFLVFSRQYGANQSQASRVTDLLDILNISERYITGYNNTTKLVDNINYAKVTNQLNELIKESIGYLKKTLKGINEMN